MVISDNFVLTDVADEYMLVPVGETAKSMKGIIAVNEPVFILLKRMAEPKSKEDLVSILTENYDVDVETTFTKSFKKGQILFGRRRAYQHKACVATIDGICSGDITVIEPIEGKVYPDLLPFIIQNDEFPERLANGQYGVSCNYPKAVERRNVYFAYVLDLE